MSGDEKSKRWSVKNPLDPLSSSPPPLQAHTDVAGKTRKANLTIRLEDETRIVNSLQDAGKKLTTGSLYSVVVDIGRNGTMDIGVKDLADNILAVSLLKRENNIPGAGEVAGLRLGDIIFGINFIPVREGSKTLITIVKLETEKKKKFIHIQGWRCQQLCSDPIPGYLFPRANDMFVHSYSLFRAKVFSEWERWNFTEILLSHMVDDLHMRTEQENVDKSGENATGMARFKQMQVLDLEKNILQAKGLRTALNVRIVHTKNKEEPVIYVLRIEDVESGLHWTSNRRYNEFYQLYEELTDISQFMREIEFPKKKLALRSSVKLIESRIVALESFLRRALHLLTTYASFDSSASKALRHLQRFLGVDHHLDCIHPPIVDDQRTVEMLAYRFLNDYNSPACQQCVRFIHSVDLESMLDQNDTGYKGLLSFIHDALNEVEQFVLSHHEQQLVASVQSRRPEWLLEQCSNLVKQCIRRQVESALYLPLRREIFRLISPFLQEKAKKFQRAIALLQQAKPSVFMVDDNVIRTKALPRCIQAFRKAMLAFLPVDFGQFLIEAAYSISELYGECRELRRTSCLLMKIKDEHHARQQRLPSSSSFDDSITTNGNNGNNEQHEVLTPDQQRQSIRIIKDFIIHAKSNSSNDTTLPFPRMNSNSSTSTTGGNGGNGSGFSRRNSERRPSLQERIKDYVEVDHTTANNSEGRGGLEGDDEIDAVFSHRVSFSIAGNTTNNNTSSNNTVYTSGTSPSSRSLSTSSINPGITRSMSSSSCSANIINNNNTTITTSQQNKRMAFEAVECYINNQMMENNPTNTNTNTAINDTNGDIVRDESNNTTAIANTMALHPLEIPSSSVVSKPVETTTAAATGSVSPVNSNGNGNGSNKNSSGGTSLKRVSIAQNESMIDPLLRPPMVNLEEMNRFSGNNIDEEVFAEVFSQFQERFDLHEDGSLQMLTNEEMMIKNAISADDFLPLFTYVMVFSQVPQLIILKELMCALISNEDTYGECGYYLATLEAAIEHVNDLASQYEDIARSDGFYDDDEDIYEYSTFAALQ